MKKVNIVLLLSFLATICLHAQQRRVDMELVYDALQPVDTLPIGSPIPYRTILINHGPDALMAGDSLFITLVDNSANILIMPSQLPQGDSILLFDLVLNYSGDTTETFNICTKVSYDPNHQVLIGGQPVLVGYVDPNPDNNEICSQVTMLAEGATAVNSVGKTDFGFRLYPNPYSNGNIHIENDKDYTIQEIRIADVMGREVFKLTGNDQSSVSFLLPDYISDGIYLLHVLTKKGEQVLRLQVVH